MTWVGAAVGAGVGGLLSYSKNKQDQANQKASMLANAAQIQFSPWTHAAVQVQGPTAQNGFNSALGGAMQGGLAGAAFKQQFDKVPAAAAGSAGPMNLETNATPSALGGNQMSNDLGMAGNQFNNGYDPDFWNKQKQTLYASK